MMLEEDFMNIIKMIEKGDPAGEFLLNEMRPPKMKSDFVDLMMMYYKDEISKYIIIEECGELQKTITKDLRGKTNRADILEELADVIICAQMTMSLYGFSEQDIKEEYRKKMFRNLDRAIKGDKKIYNWKVMVENIKEANNE